MEFAVGTVNSVTARVVGLIFATLLLPYSANQRLPSGPAAMPSGCELAVVRADDSVKAWVVGLIRPILLPTYSVNQRLPSGPAAMPYGWALAVGMVDSVIAIVVGS